MSIIRFEGKKPGEAECVNEVALLAASRSAGVELNHTCGGHARCGTCIVTILSGQEALSPIGAAEARVLKVLKAKPDQRLACQAWAKGDVSCSA